MKFVKFLLATSLCLLLVGCKNEKIQMYSYSFIGPFDTQFEFKAYANNQKEFDSYSQTVKSEFEYYNQLFDKYNLYEGVNNIKTINDYAGQAPISVEQPIIDLLEMNKQYYYKYSNNVNVAMGSVLEIWHNAREMNDGTVPSKELLDEANKYTDLEKVVIDKDKNTVYIEEGMSLDVGATAKGFASERVKEKLIEVGCESFLLSAGGNIVSHGKRLVEADPSSLSKVLPNCLTHFAVGVQSPQDGAYENKVNTVALILDGTSVVTSGDYQRYFIGDDGNYYHHIIDPISLFPPHYFRSVTILTNDSSLADFLSSAVYLMPLDQGQAFIESMEGVEAVWLCNDGTIVSSSGLVEGENYHLYD